LLDAGNDFSYNYLAGGKGNDELYGGWGRDYMVGGSGNDILFGNTGNDYLDGGSGFDRLFGEDGDDELIGGVDQTSDEMWGGAGKDTFHDEIFHVSFSWNSERRENIRDYHPGIDKIV
jgi:Ca2+-binding RTX toxin-like protein